MQINYLDLFSGVGGFTRGLLDAGFTFGWHGFSEIDKHAVKLYQGLYPDAEAMGDITNISTDEIVRLSRGIGGINLITFGFPCQDLSIAGNRKGLAGKRSGLFYEALRIIGTVRPDCFVFENVKGLFSSKNGADFKAVLQAVADIGLYDCQWQLLNTKWFLPQNRERIYFVGHLRKQQLFGREIFPVGETDEIHNKQKQDGSQQTVIAVLTPERPDKRQNGRRFKAEGEPMFTLTGQDRHGVMIIDHQGRKNNEYKPTEHCPTLRSESHGNQPCVVEVRGSMQENAETMYNCSTSLTSAMGMGGGQIPIVNRIRRLNPLECFRLQFGMRNADIMIAKAKELNISDTQLYKQAGNAVSSPVVEMIGRKLLQAVEG